jgi:riboflavin kinase/FMN adenylyltransferase
MQVWWDPEVWQQDRAKITAPVSMTIGNFDGVHRGHQELLKATTEAAHASQGFSLLLTFHPHPAQILAPERQHVRLFGLQDQQEELSRRGLQGLLRQPFSREFSEISAEDFLEHYLLKYFQPQTLIVGHDFSFGAHRRGNFEMLANFCTANKIHLKRVSPFQIENETVSTSNIRKHLLSGEVQVAEKMLGRKYYLKGIVEKGAARGRQLGFPTANVRPDVDFYPRMGVYVCDVTRVGLVGPKLRAVMNVGINRTFVEGDHQPIKAEVHILDFSEDLYGQTLKIEFCSFLRDEKRFASLDELKKQIAADVETARHWSPA